jgi:hypothetical protein
MGCFCIIFYIFHLQGQMIDEEKMNMPQNQFN